MKLFIVTGEYSGDIHGSYVVKALRNINPDIEIEGIGGENLKAESVKLFADHEKMSSVGLSLKIIIDHIMLGKRVVDYVTKEYKPDAVLLIDYGGFNLRIAKYFKKAGIKVFHYIPPQIWASRKGRINKIKKYIDEVLCIFPFEKELYESNGIKVHYCGHPLVSQLPKDIDRDAFFEKHGLDKSKKLVSIFPGSREFELRYLMKPFIKAAKNLQKKHPDLQFCISHAPNLSDKVYNKYLKNTDFKVIKGENHALLSASDGLILASGTVALEACLYKTPMIIAYKGPWLFYLIYLLVRCIKLVSLPNIILNRLFVPELLMNDVNSQKISYEIEKILYDNEYQKFCLNEFAEVEDLLSDKISSQEVAEEIVNKLNN